MNERTIELALLSGLKKDHASDREYIGDFDWRQFAKLITLECVKIADESSGWQPGYRIKQHFGVE